jgi:uncharacterized membrane protein
MAPAGPIIQVLFWVSYNVMKDKVRETFPDMPDFGVHMCAGAIADMLATSVYVPLDIVAQRVQVSHC